LLEATGRWCHAQLQCYTFGCPFFADSRLASYLSIYLWSIPRASSSSASRWSLGFGVFCTWKALLGGCSAYVKAPGWGHFQDKGPRMRQ
jgi:hypothetical protein